MELQITPQQVFEAMWEKDRFSAWLDLKADQIEEGHCRLHFKIRAEMLNGFGSAHGGVIFAAADSAFAFACNSHGLLTVALEVSINYTRPVKLHDTLFIDAQEIYRGNKTGLYEVRVTNEKNELVALFKGTAYRTSKTIGH